MGFMVYVGFIDMKLFKHEKCAYFLIYLLIDSYIQDCVQYEQYFNKQNI